MKINKIILLSHWGLIFLFPISLSIVGFAFKNKSEHTRKVEASAFEQKSIPLKKARHLFIEKGCRVNISGDATSQLLYNNNKTLEEIKPIFEIRNDTLFITSSKSNANEWVDIHTNSIETITCNGSQLDIYNLHQDSLKITGNQAKFTISNNSAISFAQIVLTNDSAIEGWNYKGDALALDINHSKAQFSLNNSGNKLEKIEGKITNSFLRIPVSKTVALDSDEASEIKMY